MRAVLVHVILMMLSIRYAAFPVYVAVKPVEFICGAHKVGMNVRAINYNLGAREATLPVMDYPVQTVIVTAT